MKDLKSALEAVLFAAGESVPVGRLSLVFAVEPDEVLQAARELAEEYDRESRGIRLLRMDNKLQMCSSPEYAQLIVKTLEQTADALSVCVGDTGDRSVLSAGNPGSDRKNARSRQQLYGYCASGTRLN